jgi:inosine/xanthosine triphosphatase
MQICVGSNNPVKVGAVRAVFEEVYPGCSVFSEAVSSGVSAQPRSEEETRRGALNRAKLALGAQDKFDFGVGLEGGVFEIGEAMFECAWIAIVDRAGTTGLGGGLYFELPEKVAKRIRGGEELGLIMEDYVGKEVKKGSGAIGVFTKGMLTRQMAYEQIVKMALIRWSGKEWFA